ncbi:MAG: hypothetical protein JO325_06800, partial [Solirubrobacterales bacterium]|nr:hypothetical protein [Solirubrobacterales bacterium]
PRTLTVSAVKLSDRSTGVRADAEVRYTAPCLAAQRIPPQAHVLDVTIDTFTFRASPAGAALAQVTEPADEPTTAGPCFITTLQVRGQREPGLLEGGKLLRQSGAILGLKLTTRP